MKKINDLFAANESDDFKPFNEHELAMVLGGGGDEQILDFLQEKFPIDDAWDVMEA